MNPAVAAGASAGLGLIGSPLLAAWTRGLADPSGPGRRRVAGPPGWWRPRPVGTTRLIGTAVAAILAGLAGGAASHGDWSWPAWTVLALVLVPLAVVDAEHHRLPDALMLPGLALGAVLLVVAGLADGHPGRGLGCLLAALVTGAGFTALALVSPASIGLGDAKLAALLSAHLAWLGVAVVLTGLVAGFVLGAVAAIVLLAARRAVWRSAIALGPPLIAGALVVAALS